jgi:hypothetical protein
MIAGKLSASWKRGLPDAHGFCLASSQAETVRNSRNSFKGGKKNASGPNLEKAFPPALPGSNSKDEFRVEPASLLALS